MKLLIRRTCLAPSILALAVVAATPGRARADAPDVVWEALKEREVVVEMSGGGTVAGKLIGLKPDTVVVLTDSGEPKVLERNRVAAVRGRPAAPPAPLVGVTPPAGNTALAPELLVGNEVVLETTEGARLGGKLVAIDDKTLILGVGDGQRLRFQRATLKSVRLAEAKQNAVVERQWIGSLVLAETRAGQRITGTLVEISAIGVMLESADGQRYRFDRTALVSLRLVDEASGQPVRAVSAEEPPARAFDLRGYAGLVVRPLVCVSACSEPDVSFGAEVGYWFIGLAARIAPRRERFSPAADVRLFYEFRPIPRLTITPVLEVSAIWTFADGDLERFQVALHPGARIGYQPVPRFMLFAEPLGFEIGVHTVDARLDSVPTMVRYAPTLGAQVRF